MKNFTTEEIIQELYDRNNCIVISNIFTTDNINEYCKNMLKKSFSTNSASEMIAEIKKNTSNSAGVDFAKDDLDYFINEYERNRRTEYL